MAANVERLLKAIISIVAVGMSAYHLTVAFIGAPQALFFRSTHLLFALTLVFLLYPGFRRREGARASWPELIWIALAIGTTVYIWVNHEHLLTRFVFVDDPTQLELVLGFTFTLIVLEATRRVIGWPLPVTAVIFLCYALFIAKSRPEQIIEIMYLTTEGIFGPTLGVSAAYVIMFVLFGAFMERTGIGQLFMDFALSLTGHTAGGPGKVAVVSSSLFGTVSGSAVANVLVDGPITIPLMKRTGFKPAFAAAVESVASTGGQIMPPIMGAAAFVMAEFLAVPYAQVALWALLPALLYYVAVFFAVHFEAKRYKLAGVPAAELPRFADVMLQRGHLFIPILIILFGLIAGYSAPLCALVAAISCLPIALARAATRAGIRWKTPIDALDEGARNALAVAMACACAGIVIGCVTITGLGIVFTQIVESLSQDSLILALILTAMAGIILGMGMPTTPAYIMMVALLVPAVIKLAVSGCPQPVSADCRSAMTPAAHMFAFYFAILSAITPPVALAVFAAAGLAKANMWATGFAAMRAAAPAYIVPFMFVYEPMLLLVVKDWAVQWHQVLLAAVTAIIGVICLASSLHGWLLALLPMWQRVLLFASAMFLIKPGLFTDAAGIGLLAVVLAGQLFARRRLSEAALRQ